MTQAIIFDCFGVLATEGWIAFKRKYFGDDRAKMDRASELSRMLDSGLIDYDESVREIAEMAGVSTDKLNTILKDVAANDELLGYIRDELKPKYKIGMLSNVGDNWLYTIFDKDDIAMFDAIELSHESGVVKPDPRSYGAVAAKLEVAPEDAIFIDDLERNVSGAQDVGMRAIRYHDFDQMKSELEKLLSQS